MSVFVRALVIVPVFLLSLSSCGPELKPGVEEAYVGLPEEIDYNFHVKPILSDRCFACHGPDAQNQQAGLRLDTEEGAYAALESGNGVAIKPGSLGGSELIRRINATDPEIVMPTPESNLSLTDREIAILTKWVEQGAEYKEHWAFTAPASPPVPPAGANWARNEIDRFVAAKLAAEGVTPSPEAERPYLIRRLYFDLTGLPPTPAEIAEWTAAGDDGWYERLVDDLLSRPAYGERMATYWMDVARFADTEGYLDDFHHELWPYRDWVIGAYNKNLPYDRFIEWQVGGDQFEDPSREQILATTFNRAHKQNSEGGIIPEEFRVEYVADRANTVGTAFMGLTVACARCHDHKYDPFSQQNYYELFGFFNNTVERGDGIFAMNAIEDGRRVSNFHSMNAGPTLPLPAEETRKIYDYLLAGIEAGEDSLRGQRDALAGTPTAPTAGEVDRYLRQHTVNYLTFDELPVRDLAPGGEILRAARGGFGEGHRGRAAVLGSSGVTAEGSRSRFERSDPFTISFSIHTPKFFEEGVVFYNSNGKNQGYRGWDVTVDSNRVVLRLSHAYPYQSITLRMREPLREGEWSHFVWTYDGSSNADGMRVWRDGELAEPEVLRDHLVRSTLPYTESEALVYERYKHLTVGGRHYDQDFNGGSVDEIRILDVEAGALLAAKLYTDVMGHAFEPTEADLREYEFLHRDAAARAARQDLHRMRLRAVQTIDTVREVMVMGDDTRLRPTYILNRGVYDQHGERVNPGVPENMLAWPDELPRNRYGLAKWLTHPDNPLTARVAVNQMWYVIFGRGLVETVEDFGNQGALPSHPALLDWLAVDFRDNGWDVKRLIRQLVTSATYRQSSRVRDDLTERDPENYWLARAPRYRRSAEMVRDNALAASGLLERKIGGQSVFPQQPPGLWKEVGNHAHSARYHVDSVDGLYRRSMYTFWKRNSPAPAMLVFDASLRSECQVRRQRSNTPLQALVLLNDPQVVEACRVLAARTLAESPDRAAIDAVFLSLTGREITESERDILLDYYADELEYFRDHPVARTDYLSTGYHDTDLSAGESRVAALGRVAGAVINSTEGYYKN